MTAQEKTIVSDFRVAEEFQDYASTALERAREAKMRGDELGYSAHLSFMAIAVKAAALWRNGFDPANPEAFDRELR